MGKTVSNEESYYFAGMQPIESSIIINLL